MTRFKRICPPLLALVLLVPLQATAQKRMLKALDKQDYVKAWKAAQRLEAKRPEHPILWFGYARFYAEPDNIVRFDLHKAYTSLLTAYDCWEKKTDETHTGYQEHFNITINTLNALREYIADTAYTITQRHHNIDSLLAYQQRYSHERRYILRAQQEIWRLGHAQAIAQHTIKGYQHFLDQYPGAPRTLRFEAFTQWDKLVYATETQAGTYQAYRAYIEGYCQQAHWGFMGQHCQKAQGHYHQKLYEHYAAINTLDSWQEFLRLYPESPHVNLAHQEAFKLWFGQHPIASLEAKEGYVKAFPHSPYAPEVWNLIKATWLVDDDLRSVVAMKEHYQFWQGFPAAPLAVEEQRLNEFNLSLGPLVSAMPEGLDSVYDHHIRDLAPREPAYVALLRMVEAKLKHKEWQEAASTLRQYQATFSARPQQAEKLQQLINLISTPEPPLTVAPLDTSWHSTQEEYMPVPSADGRYLYFIRKAKADSLHHEDIFYCQRVDSTGGWSVPKALASPINTPGDEGLMSLSTGGTQLLVWGKRQPAMGRGDLYAFNQTANGWEGPHLLPAPANSPYFDCDASLVNGGQAILFASERPGGVGNRHPYQMPYHGGHLGNLDLWITEKQANGQWGQPINLGEVVNTPFAERSPFLHPDGKTLYFSSDGHHGLGRLDVFMCRRLNDSSWTEWSPPINLGKTLNSTADNWGYKVSTDGQTLYFAALTITDSLNHHDLYQATLPHHLRATPVVAVSGTVIDEHGQPLAATLHWENLASGQAIGSAAAHPADGNFFMALPPGLHYGYYASKPGYYPVSNHLNLQDSTRWTAQEQVQLVSLETIINEGRALPVNNVFFATGKHLLQPESHAELGRLATLIGQISSHRFELGGHTDNVGTEAANRLLSERRAQAVKDYLVNTLGIPEDRLLVKGYGPSQPVAPNTTIANRARNRRVEFRLVH